MILTNTSIPDKFEILLDATFIKPVYAVASATCISPSLLVSIFEIQVPVMATPCCNKAFLKLTSGIFTF